MKNVVQMTCILAALSSLSYGQIAPDHTPMQKTLSGSNRFAFELHRHLADSNNLVFSPLSISMAMAMVYTGAAGTTADQIQTALHFPEPEELMQGYKRYLQNLSEQSQEYNKLLLANALWVQNGFQITDDYQTILREIFDSESREADFLTPEGRKAAADDINKWIEEKTENLIRNMIQPTALNPLTRLVLANAIYFRGAWKEKFDEKLTRDDIFHLLGGEETVTGFMKLTSRFKLFQDASFSLLEMPYDRDELSMRLVLPAENDIATFMETFSYDTYEQAVSGLMYEDVLVMLPKFSFEYAASLKETLVKMGVEDAFTGVADFSGMTGTTDLKIDKVLHKAFIDVNEEGAEAAAATVVTMMEKSARLPSDIYLFKADRPFLFMITDNITGAILFMGVVMDPSGN